MRVAFITSEAVPFAKTGGLADVSGALPRALRKLGHEVALIMPFYRSARESGQHIEETGVSLAVPVGDVLVEGGIMTARLPESDVPVYFIRNDAYYERAGLYGTPEGDYQDNCARFVFFARAAIELMRKLKLEPEVIHCHDWQTGLIPPYLRILHSSEPEFRRAAILFTIHNMAFQGVFWHWDMKLIGLPWQHFNWRELEFYGKVNFMKGGLVYADLINTVSPNYSREIQTPEFGAGLDGVLRERAADLFGVVNGIDYTVWNPATDKFIAANYTADDLSGKRTCKRALQKLAGLPQRNVPLLGMITRLDEQKGLDLVAEILPKLMKLEIQFILLGTGHERFHKFFQEVSASFPDKVGIFIKFDNALAHQIEAGADMFLMPSRYEPCGLNQLYSLKYGTPPIVREVGGLADTIVNCTPRTLKNGEANGFSFKPYSSTALMGAIRRALKLYEDRSAWRRLMRIGMSQDWSWERSAAKYEELYAKAIEKRNRLL